MVAFWYLLYIKSLWYYVPNETLYKKCFFKNMTMENIMKNKYLLVAILIFIFSIKLNSFASGYYYYNQVLHTGQYDYSNNSETRIDYTDNNAWKQATGVLNNIKLRQNDDCYFLDYDIDYTCTGLTWNGSTVVGTNLWSRTDLSDPYTTTYNYYQTVSSGNIVLTDNTYQGVACYLYRSDASNGIYKSSGYAKASGLTSSHNLEYRYNENYFESCKWNNFSYTDPISSPIAGLDSIYYANNTLYYSGYFGTGSNKKIIRGGDYNIYLCSSGGVSISQNATSLSNSYFSFNYKGTITIPKSVASSFKYIILNAPTAVCTNHTYKHYRYESGGNYETKENITYTGCYGTGIDISEYLNCNHDFEVIESVDKINHKIM